MRRPPSAGERQFRHPFGQRHNGRQRQRGRTADDDVDAERDTAPQRGRMMHADATMDLVVQPHLAIRLVLIAR